MSKHEFEEKLRSIRRAERGLTPDPAWVLRTRETLMMQVQNSMPVAPMPFWTRVRESFRPFSAPTRLVGSMRRQVIAVLSVFGVVAGSSLMSVSAADNSIPGDLLYPVKLAAEQTRLILTKDKTDKLKLKTEFVGRRVEEIKSLATSDASEKPDRLKQMAEIVKRDLDTVKIQLADMKLQKQTVKTTEAVRMIDQKSTELATALKDAKVDMSADVQSKVSEAEVAAVSTGVKAVQALIDSKTNPDTKDVVSSADLVQSINNKVQGLQNNVTDAAARAGMTVVITTSTNNNGVISATSSTVTLIAPNTTSTDQITQIVNAQESLMQTKQLLQENKLDEVSDKLTETAKAVVSAEQVGDALVVTGASPAPTSSAPVLTTATGTPAVTSTTTEIKP
ncbi:MAG: DUF5667 domain-containing protein [bacterium]|nr:DUF5667 domain-containing protein [bacterium]